MLRNLIGPVHAGQVGAAIDAETFLSTINVGQVHELPEPVVHREGDITLGPGTPRMFRPAHDYAADGCSVGWPVCVVETCPGCQQWVPADRQLADVALSEKRNCGFLVAAPLWLTGSAGIKEKAARRVELRCRFDREVHITRAVPAAAEDHKLRSATRQAVVLSVHDRGRHVDELVARHLVEEREVK